MPKENKRFINPLLRPSQDTPQLEQEQPPVTNSDVTSPATDTAQANSVAQAQEQPARSRVNSIRESETEPLRPTADVDTPSLLDADDRNVNASTGSPRTQGEQGAKKSPSVAANDTASPRNRSSAADTARPAASTSRSTARSSTSSASNGKNTAPASTTFETSYPRSNQGEAGEDRAQNYRRRVEVRFENVHERLTVWIDRDLKRGLEDLASKHNVSKTTLINEAMADLLKKYEV